MGRHGWSDKYTIILKHLHDVGIKVWLWLKRLFMEKSNVFKSSDFYMNEGDALHILVKSEEGDAFVLGLYGGTDPSNEDKLEALASAPLEDYDGNVYTTVIIGNQEWIVENLKVTNYADGTPIPNLIADVDWAAEDGFTSWGDGYCWYNNDFATYGYYGCLYKWWCIENPNFIEFNRGGIVDAGWRVASHGDYVNLSNQIGGVYIAGGAMKEDGTTHWNAPNVGATNSSGFTAIANGAREVDGFWVYHGDQCVLWTSTDDLSLDGIHVNQSQLAQMYRQNAIIDLHGLSLSGGYGFSIRCVRDV